MSVATTRTFAFWQADDVAEQYIDVAIERLIEIPGRRTVVVGTIVTGSVVAGESIEFRGVVALCAANERYHELLDRAVEGDRVGLLLDGVRPTDLKIVHSAKRRGVSLRTGVQRHAAWASSCDQMSSTSGR
jgi:translation elongation factor EF-Tu-like GTPase